jgi:hypothetical protein
VVLFGAIFGDKRVPHPLREVDIERSTLVDVTDLVSS